MTWTHVHTIVNHFPIVLSVVGMIAALAGLVWPRRTIWMYALVSLTLAGVLAWPAWFTGDQAADQVRHAWYIAPGAVRNHAAAADTTLWVLLAVGVLAAFAWWRLVRVRDAVTLPAWLRILVVVASIASFGAVVYTGWLGGGIVVNSPILASPVPPAPVPDTVRLGPAGTPISTPTTPAPVQQSAPRVP